MIFVNRYVSRKCFCALQSLISNFCIFDFYFIHILATNERKRFYSRNFNANSTISKTYFTWIKVLFTETLLSSVRTWNGLISTSTIDFFPIMTCFQKNNQFQRYVMWLIKKPQTNIDQKYVVKFWIASYIVHRIRKNRKYV